MSDFSERLRTRIFPALLTAIGVTMLAVGLLSYTTPVDAGPLASGDPTPGVGQASPSPRITLPPLGSARTRDGAAVLPADRVATRVRIEALGIDLPVIKPPAARRLSRSATSRCTSRGDALYQPGEGKATYLYAHARAGCSCRILDAIARERWTTAMLGMIVEVYTSDDQLFLYQITEVRRHQLEPQGGGGRDHRAALAADLRGPQGDARQDPGPRRAPVVGGRPTRRGPPDAAAGRTAADPRGARAGSRARRLGAGAGFRSSRSCRRNAAAPGRQRRG